MPDTAGTNWVAVNSETVVGAARYSAAVSAVALPKMPIVLAAAAVLFSETEEYGFASPVVAVIARLLNAPTLTWCVGKVQEVPVVHVPRASTVDRIGLVPNTAAPLPVSSVRAPDKLADENEPREVALPDEVTAPVRLALVVTLPAVRLAAVPVRFVATPDVGVPSPPPLTTNAPAVPVLTPSAVTTPVPVVVVADACNPPPITKELSVRAAALVTQVGQARVPVVVMVPPVIGEVVAMLVTVPAPHPNHDGTPEAFSCKQFDPLLFPANEVHAEPFQ